jgi:hypothetical protein
MSESIHGLFFSSLFAVSAVVMVHGVIACF